MAVLAFTLLLRLPDGFALTENARDWTRWQAASSVVPQAEYGDPNDEPPYKRFPGQREYFSAPALGALYPQKDGDGAGRWVRRPRGWEVGLVEEDGPGTRLGVDLLEVVRVGIPPYVCFGVAHLRLDDELDANAMLSASRALATRYRASEDHWPKLEVLKHGEGIQLGGLDPLAGLAHELFGSAHDFVSLRAYFFAAAEVPDSVSKESENPWRRALGQPQALDRAISRYRADPSRDLRRTEWFGSTAATFFGRSAGVTFRSDAPQTLRNIRSYWAETVLFGLIQHAYVEDFAIKMGELGGNPLDERIDPLYRRWLVFRNVMWWHHLSYTTDIANKILRHAHAGFETRSLHTELEHSFSTYVEARRVQTSDAESRALQALQVGGAAFAVIGSLAAILQVAGEDYLDALWACVLAIGAVLAGGAAAAWQARRILKGRHSGSGSGSGKS